MTGQATDVQLIAGDFLAHVGALADGSVDLIVADPPYGLGKDYGNDSDKRSGDDYLDWSYGWLAAALPKLKRNGSLYLFCTWQYAPELFVWLKQRLQMVNEIIWDRRVPSMGGSTRKYSSVHDNIGFFVGARDYYFDLDAVRVPYDEETKKARSRKLFEGSKWLELGHNPKDIWSVSRIHRQAPERADEEADIVVDRRVFARARSVCRQRHDGGRLRAARSPLLRLRNQPRLPCDRRCAGRGGHRST